MADIRVGGVYADFRARNAQFLKGARQNGEAMRRQQRSVRALQRSMRSFNATARNTAKSIFSIRSAVGLLAGGGGLGLLIRRQAQYGATLIETSKSTAFTVEQQQLLGRAFEADGAKLEQVDKALQRFLRTTSEAGKGLQTYRREFNALGINVDEFLVSGRSQYELLLDVADGLQAIPNQANRVAAAYQLFGREGVTLLTVLQRGREDFAATVESFRQFGLVTQDEAQRLKNLEQTYADLGNVVRTALAKAVAETADNFADLNTTLASTLPNTFRSLIRGLVTVLENFDTLVHIGQVMLGVWIANTAAVRALAVAFTSARTIALGFAAALRVLARASGILLIVEGVIQLIKFFGNLTDVLNETGQSFSEFAKGAAVALVEGIGRGLLAIVQTFINLPLTILRAIASPFYILGESIIEAVKSGISGGDFASAFTEQLVESSNAALSSVADALFAENPASQLADSIDIAKLLGIESAPAKAALGEAFRRTIEDAKNLFRSSGSAGGVSGDSATSAPQEAAAFLSGQAGPANQLITANNDFQQSLEDAERRRIADIEFRIGLLGREAGEVQRLTAQYEIRNRFIERERQLRQTLAQAIEAGDVAGQANAIAAIEQFKELASEQQGLIDLALKRVDAEMRLADQQRQTSLQQQKLQGIANDTGQAFADFANQAILNFENIEDAVEQLGRSIIQNIINNLVAIPLSNAISTGLSSAFSGGGGTTPPPTGTARFASGGFARGGLALVGERGPELVDFRNPARVYPNDELREAVSGGGGNGVVINFSPNISSVDESGVRRALVGVFPEFQERVRASIAQDLKRPSVVRGR